MAKKISMTFAATSFCCFVTVANNLFEQPLAVLKFSLIGGIFFTGLVGIVWAAALTFAPQKTKKFQEMLEAEE